MQAHTLAWMDLPNTLKLDCQLSAFTQLNLLVVFQ